MFDKPITAGTERDTQDLNRRWWQLHPMNYDWRQTVHAPEGSPEFFDVIDRRFFASSPFYAGGRPFEELIPFHRLAGKDVLEIGCGMGAHAQLFCAAGCNLTAIDLTTRAVDLTRRRLDQSGFTADVRVMDAENLQFDASSFDFVWSWGVIHHSSDTEAIVREVRRVLRPGGEFRCMVYNTYSLDALWRLARATLTGRLRPGTSVEALLRTSTDGWLARHFTSRTLAEMLENCGLSDIKVQVLGQRSELVPLPGSLGLLKEAVQRRLPDAVVRAILRHVGWYLLATAIKYEAP